MMVPFMHDEDNLNSRGAVGQIFSVTLPKLIVHGTNQAEQAVMVSSSTLVRFLRSPATINDIKVGDDIVVVGYPDNAGNIIATFIRIVPSPSSSSSLPPPPQIFRR